MKKLIILIVSIFCLVNTYGQGSSPSEEILDAYKSGLIKLDNWECGHIMDGPLGLVKQAERSALDQLIQVSTEQEGLIGEKVYQEISSQINIVKGHWLQEDLDRMVEKLTQDLKRSGIDYKIKIFEAEEINAFAILGGYIYVTTGLLDFVESMDELAFILAHEISHIDLQHTLRKHKKILTLNSLGSQFNLGELTQVTMNVGLMLSAPFDQIDEYEADRNGFYLAKDAGYDEEKFTDFFEKLVRRQKENIFTKITSTHPFPSDRIECIHNY